VTDGFFIRTQLLGVKSHIEVMFVSAWPWDQEKHIRNCGRETCSNTVTWKSLRQICWEGGEWMEVAQDHVQWMTLY
jgi:cation transport regulator ChaB